MTLSPPPFEPDADARFGDAILDAGVRGLASLYRAGTTDPVAVSAHYLSRIEHFDGRIGAFAAIDRHAVGAAGAASAIRWARGEPLSALDGVPLAVKSNIAVAGLPWTAGIGAYRDRIARDDAACVARLRAGGAIILGTVNMHEAALGATTDNPWFGRTSNPYRHGYTPGGSSGGSAAAVAAGFCAAALGTDTLGSVRIPASYCGVFGYKPAFGTIDRAGIVPLAPSLDTVGVLARSAEDCAAVATILGDAQGGPAIPRSVGIGGFDGEQPLRSVLERLRALGIGVAPVAFEAGIEDRLTRSALLLAATEGAGIHAALLRDETEEISPELRKLFAWVQAQPAASLAQARAALAEATETLTEKVRAFGCIITPTTPSTAYPFGEAGARDAARFTLAASLCGLPAVAFPVGLDPNGLPYSAQVMGEDAGRVLRLAELLAVTPPSPDLL